MAATDVIKADVIKADVIRVLVVDDHPVTRRGLRDTLADVAGFEVAGQAADWG